MPSIRCLIFWQKTPYARRTSVYRCTTPHGAHKISAHPFTVTDRLQAGVLLVTYSLYNIYSKSFTKYSITWWGPARSKVYTYVQPTTLMESNNARNKWLHKKQLWIQYWRVGQNVSSCWRHKNRVEAVEMDFFRRASSVRANHWRI